MLYWLDVIISGDFPLFNLACRMRLNYHLLIVAWSHLVKEPRLNVIKMLAVCKCIDTGYFQKRASTVPLQHFIIKPLNCAPGRDSDKRVVRIDWR